ncbi:MAG: signal peptidase II [Pirellulales bacterium]|nr:signal peptidase II [Pirellulales bacterium]
MRKAVPLSRYLVFFTLAIGVCAADLISKHLAFKLLHWPNHRIHWIWEGVFGFQASLNTGGLFGLWQGFSLVLATMSILAAAAIFVWLFPFTAAKDRTLTISLGLVTAGILGNLYDRLGLPGLRWPEGYLGQQPGELVHAVRDFIVMIEIGQWHWPNYNIADCSLVCGAALLVWHTVFANGGQGGQDAKPVSA